MARLHSRREQDPPHVHQHGRPKGREPKPSKAALLAAQQLHAPREGTQPELPVRGNGAG
jgi:hypothetical protein